MQFITLGQRRRGHEYELAGEREEEEEDGDDDNNATDYDEYDYTGQEQHSSEITGEEDVETEEEGKEEEAPKAEKEEREIILKVDEDGIKVLQSDDGDGDGDGDGGSGSGSGDVHIHVRTLLDGRSLRLLWDQVPWEELLAADRLSRVVEERFVTEHVLQGAVEDSAYDHAGFREAGEAAAGWEGARRKKRGRRRKRRRLRRRRRNWQPWQTSEMSGRGRLAACEWRRENGWRRRRRGRGRRGCDLVRTRGGRWDKRRRGKILERTGSGRKVMTNLNPRQDDRAKTLRRQTRLTRVRTKKLFW